MNIYDLADIIHKSIVITRYPNQNGRFSASFEHCETKQGGCLCSEYGNGKNLREALNDYTSRISGKILVFNAMSDTCRQEFVAPKMEDL